MRSVLIVDDEARIRAVLVRWLAPEYEISEAPDADTALAMIDAKAPDVVLCDVEMPGHGGLWLIERLREQHRQVAVVLATGVSTVPATISMQAGVVEYLLKPFERARVMAAVAHAVEWRMAALARGPESPANDPIEEWLAGRGAGGPRQAKVDDQE